MKLRGLLRGFRSPKTKRVIPVKRPYSRRRIPDSRVNRIHRQREKYLKSIGVSANGYSLDRMDTFREFIETHAKNYHQQVSPGAERKLKEQRVQHIESTIQIIDEIVRKFTNGSYEISAVDLIAEIAALEAERNDLENQLSKPDF